MGQDHKEDGDETISRQTYKNFESQTEKRKLVIQMSRGKCYMKYEPQRLIMLKKKKNKNKNKKKKKKRRKKKKKRRKNEEEEV